MPPDLAVVMTPAETVPGICGAGREGHQGRRIISAGPGAAPRPRGQCRWRRKLLRIAQPHLLRIVGPNCIGYIVPRHGLNASFGPARIKAGRLAAIAQSGAVLAGSPTGAARRASVSRTSSRMGDMADVDFGDMLDMLARDYDTRAVLMYVEGVTQARKFMSAARSVARLKPVIVLKAGRHAAAAQAAASHTGAMAGLGRGL